MSQGLYGREALRKLREEQAAAGKPQEQMSLLAQIPADAPMDDATITYWNGEAFVTREKWLLSRAVATVDCKSPASLARPPAGGDEPGRAVDQYEQEGLFDE